MAIDPPLSRFPNSARKFLGIKKLPMRTLRATQSQAPPSVHTLRAGTDLFQDTAEPSLTSGFGTVIDHERTLEASTEASLLALDQTSSTALRRILGDQRNQLGTNIALLEQRYQALPHPERFQALRLLGTLPKGARHNAATSAADPLPPLIAQHRTLLGNIASLMARRADGQRGELILAEVARRHEAMTWTLIALGEPTDAARDTLPVRVFAGAPSAFSSSAEEGNWENEGGASRPALNGAGFQRPSSRRTAP